MTRPNRKTIRLQTYDYSSQGAYFITCATNERTQIFSKIENGIVSPTRWGEIVQNVWRELPSRYPVVLDEIVIMPDHLHCVIFIDGKDPFANAKYFADTEYIRQRRVMLLFKVMGYWKATVTKQMRAAGFKGDVWQARFWDRVVRDEAELNRIRNYIRSNPRRWSRIR